jgi:sugar transferase (PEP-CTERM/EpsH1 system associated)
MRPTILYLAHRLPYPPDKGDRLRTYHILRFLSQAAGIHLASLADEPFGVDSRARLSSVCERVEIVSLEKLLRPLRAAGSFFLGRTVSEGAFASSRLRSLIREWAGTTRYHGVVASASSLAPYLQLPELRGVPLFVDMMDVDSRKWFDFAGSKFGPRAVLFRAEGRRLRRLEQQLGTLCKAVVVVSQGEADIYRQNGGRGVHVVPNGVDLNYFLPQGDLLTEPRCIFVGALNYQPNIQGIRWFCREVWPNVVRQRPNARLSIVGRRPSPEVRELGSLPGVDVIGQVPDVRPYLARARVAVAPLQIAPGIQNKVLEGLAMGKAVVASPASALGLAVEPGIELLVAAAPDEWAQSICKLMDDESWARRLGEAGRRYVEEHHRWEKCLEPLKEILGLSAPQPSPALQASVPQ